MAGMQLFDEIVRIEKLNPYHGKDGRFTTAGNAASFTYKPGASTAHDKAIQRAKEADAASKGFKGTLYHGSPATDIEEFDIGRAGQNTSSGEKLLFFTDSKQMADDFSYERLEGSTTFMQRRGKKGRVYEVDVEMKKPLDLRNLSDEDIGNLMKLDVDGILTREIAVELSGKNNQQLKTYLDLTAENLKGLGYDGLIANTGKAGHNSVEYAVVDSKQAKIRKSVAKTFGEIIEKFNPYHGKDGRFTTAGAYTSFTYAPGKSKAHDMAIQREHERTANRMPTEAQSKTLKGIETRTRNLKKEQFRVVDREGNVIMQKQGDEGSVTFTMGEAREHFPGNITIHNHPDGGTFSPADLSAIGHGATEIRAASPEGTYILRNARYGGKYNAAKEKTWYDMREDIEAASDGFKTHRQVKSEIRKPFDEQTQHLAEKWVNRKNAGADQAELSKIHDEYMAKVESFRPQIEAEARKAYVDQYHHWYQANAGKYGLEYEFIPVKTRTRKSYEVEELIENIGKVAGEEIVLDRKMNQDAKALADAIVAEMIDSFPASNGQVAKNFYEMLYEVKKANPYHDPKTGKFTTGPGGGGVGTATVGRNGVTTEEQDRAYMAAIEAGDMETAQQMVLDTAKAVGAKTFANPDTTAYSIRRGPEPQTTVTTYKTFFVDEQGNPSALFVEGTDRLPVGVWLDAKDAYHFQADNGKMYTPSRKNPNSGGSGKTGAAVKIPNDQVRQELIDQGFLPEGSTAKDVTALAYRPGWHAGDLPFFPQGGKQGNPEYNESGKPNKRYDPNKPTTNYQNIHRWNQVVFECEMAADIDYTKSTSIKSGPNKGKIKYTDMQEMPTDGYYKFATNPMTNANDLGNWYISGSLKIKRALTQQECDDILGKNGFKPQEWEGGKLDLDKLGYNPNKTDRGTKLLDPVTYDDNGKVIPLSQRFDNSTDDVRKSYDESTCAGGDDPVCTIYKTDEDKRLVFGWASISMTVDGEQLVDRQHDMIDPEDLEEAVYEYVLNFRDMGEEHIPSLRKKGKLVESCVLTEEKQRAMGIPAGILPIGWWIGFKIEDDEAWEKVKNGTYKMFSIEGKANRVPVEKSTTEESEAMARFEQILEVGKSAGVDQIVEIEKFNPYHDRLGRFASAGGAASFTFKPGKSNAHDTAIARANAKDKVAKAKAAEPKLTAMMQDCAKAAGGEMVGLKYAVKGEGSLTRKIKTEMLEKGCTAKEAAANMKDVNRYTMQLGENNFASGYEKTMKTLESQGYEVVRVKNTLADPKAPYRGVNTNIKSPDGSIWELQFHTAKSLEIKEINHELYETQRLDKTPADKKAELGRLMAENAAAIPTPKDIGNIVNINKI